MSPGTAVAHPDKNITHASLMQVVTAVCIMEFPARSQLRFAMSLRICLNLRHAILELFVKAILATAHIVFAQCAAVPAKTLLHKILALLVCLQSNH